MTRAESAKVIEDRFSIMDYCESEKLGEALDVAIDALKYQVAAEKLWEVIEQAGYEGKEVEIRHRGRLFKIREVAQ